MAKCPRDLKNRKSSSVTVSILGGKFKSPYLKRGRRKEKKRKEGVKKKKKEKEKER